MCQGFLLLTISAILYVDILDEGFAVFNLFRNIDFVLAAIVINIVLLISSKLRYKNVSKANNSYLRIVWLTLFACILDIIQTVSRTYLGMFSPTVMHLFRCAFNCVNISIALLVYMYFRSYQDDYELHNRVEDFIAGIVAVCYFVSSVFDFFLGHMTWFADDYQYVKGEMYPFIYFGLAFMIAMGFLVTMRDRKSYSRNQFIAICAFCVITVSFAGIELLFDSVVLVSLFGVSLSLLIMQSSLETPEYSSVVKAKEEAENLKAIADKANDAKSEFLARMSHEIRTPMNAVMGMNEMIINSTLEESTKVYATDAYVASKNLLEIINDILDFSKIESGKIQLTYDKFSITTILRELWGMFLIKAQDKGLNLQFDISDYMPDELIGDAGRFRQILVNLLGNAVKYTDSGTIMLRISLLKDKKDTVFFRTEVIDTGRGIKEEHLDKLFEAFERIEEKKSINIEGTGLGINITAALLNLMDSELEVNSVYGKGSTFFFDLELGYIPGVFVSEFSSADILEVATDSSVLDVNDGSVLVVDDTSLNLKVFKAFLKETNFDIDMATSGFEALDYTSKKKYDLIFMDHLMPEMNGVECFEKIRCQENGMNLDTPVIVLTANAIKGAYENYIDLGFSDVCFKPYSKDELINLINKNLQQTLLD